MNKKIFSFIFALSLALCAANTLRAQDTNSPMDHWLAAQMNIQTWSADFTQTRSLKALTQPLTSTGHVWFAAPNQFHWELGNPPQTIAVRQTDQLMLIYPRLKRAEFCSLDSKEASQWKDTLALLDAGFPRSRAEVESRFNILSQTTTNGIHELTLQPKAQTARHFMPQIKIGFDMKDFSLRSTELQFTDGSTMQNVFTNAQLNPKIADSVFHPNVDGYKVEPLFKK